MIITGFVPNEYLNVKLLILYAKAGDLNLAHILFEKVQMKSSVMEFDDCRLYAERVGRGGLEHVP